MDSGEPSHHSDRGIAPPGPCCDFGPSDRPTFSWSNLRVDPAQVDPVGFAGTRSGGRHGCCRARECCSMRSFHGAGPRQFGERAEMIETDGVDCRVVGVPRRRDTKGDLMAQWARERIDRRGGRGPHRSDPRPQSVLAAAYGRDLGPHRFDRDVRGLGEQIGPCRAGLASACGRVGGSAAAGDLPSYGRRPARVLSGDSGYLKGPWWRRVVPRSLTCRGSDVGDARVVAGDLALDVAGAEQIFPRRCNRTMSGLRR